jgi:hypothetical protein
VPKNTEVRQVEKEEAKLLDSIKGLEWGEVTVKVKDGKLVMISRREDVKLTE